MARKSSKAFRKRDDVDEVYTFQYGISSILNIDNSVVMVEYQDDQVLIIAGYLPGLTGYYNDCPDVGGEEKKRQREFSRELLDEAKTYLQEYNPKEDYSESNQGNRSMSDLYVTVDREERDRVVFKMWQMLNHMKTRYLEFLKESNDEEYLDYPSLQDEIIDISQDIEIN